MKEPKPWDRMLWGVEAQYGDKEPMIIGGNWENLSQRYDGEPLSPILFNSRSSARAWCAAKTRNSWMDLWKLRPIRVRNTTKKVR